MLVASPHCTAGLPPLHAQTVQTSPRMSRCALCLRSPIAGFLRLDACVHGIASNYEGECVTWWLTDAQTRIKRVLDSVERPRLQPVLRLGEQQHILLQLPGTERSPGQRACRRATGHAQKRSSDAAPGARLQRHCRLPHALADAGATPVAFGSTACVLGRALPLVTWLKGGCGGSTFAYSAPCQACAI